jgi:hypothetical protein
MMHHALPIASGDSHLSVTQAYEKRLAGRAVNAIPEYSEEGIFQWL